MQARAEHAVGGGDAGDALGAVEEEQPVLEPQPAAAALRDAAVGDVGDRVVEVRAARVGDRLRAGVEAVVVARRLTVGVVPGGEEAQRQRAVGVRDLRAVRAQQPRAVGRSSGRRRSGSRRSSRRSRRSSARGCRSGAAAAGPRSSWPWSRLSCASSAAASATASMPAGVTAARIASRTAGAARYSRAPWWFALAFVTITSVQRSGGAYSGRMSWSSATTSRKSDALSHARTPAGTSSGCVTRSWISCTASGDPIVTNSGISQPPARLLAQHVVGDDRAEAVRDDDERLVDAGDRGAHDRAHPLGVVAEEVRVDVLERDPDELLEEPLAERERERQRLGAGGRLELLAGDDRLGAVRHPARRRPRARPAPRRRPPRRRPARARAARPRRTPGRAAAEGAAAAPSTPSASRCRRRGRTAPGPTGA